jgi:putative hemolysin
MAKRLKHNLITRSPVIMCMLLITIPATTYGSSTVPKSVFFTNTPLIIGVFIFLLILSGLFSGSETALVSLSMAKVKALKEQGQSKMSSVEKLKSNPNRMLITILLGNNLVNIGASVIIAAWAEATFGSASLAIATAILTILVLVFGEIFPKTFAQQNAEALASYVARPILVIQTLLFPLIRLLEVLLVTSQSASGRKRKKVIQADSARELQAMVEIMGQEGRLDENLQFVMSGTFTFGKKQVLDIMTPKSRLVALEENTTLVEARDTFIKTGKSRIPIYRDRLDNVIGIMNMRMLLQGMKEDKTHCAQLPLVMPIKVHQNEFIDDLLVQLQEQRQQISIVVNNKKAIVGVATLENILEEIVGEIFDEKERYKVFVISTGKDRWRVTGDCPIYELRKQFRNFVPELPPFKSMATLFREQYSSVPKVGSTIQGENYEITIIDMKENSINWLGVDKAPLNRANET